MEFDVKFLTKHWEHHSSHSGYDQLVERLGSAIPLLDQSNLLDRIIPGRVAIWFAKRSGNVHYSYKAFYHEWAAIREMLHSHGHTIYHILYADDSFRYLRSLGRKGNSKTLASYHLPPSALHEYIKSPAYIRNLDGLIVVGRNQIPFFEPIIGLEKIFFIPLGVDTKVFIPKADSIKPATSQRVCLFVGIHRRDFITLRKVIELVNRQDHDIRFIIVTEKSKEGIFEGLENVDVKHGIPEEELIHLYQNADLLLQPLEDSTANTAILEAMSCGLPVVATDIGGVRDYMDEGCGVFVPPKDAEATAGVVLRLLGDHELRLKMIIYARAHALKYDWSMIVEQTRQVYNKMWT